ncbi:MAG: anthranilate synthase component I, partial [Clostridia bacterium]
MYYPKLEEVKGYVKDYNLVPICLEMYMDLYTPIRVLSQLQEEENYFLFESLEGEKQIARYSFIGYEPYEIIVNEKGENPFDKVRNKIEGGKVAPVEGMPPFVGGGVGYFGYETVQ